MRRSTAVAFLACGALLFAGVPAQAQQFYFEEPAVLEQAGPNARFAQLVVSPAGATLVYQRIAAGPTGGTISVVLQRSADGVSWSAPQVARDGIRYEGTSVPPVFSVAAGPREELLLAVLEYRPGDEDSPSGTSLVRLSYSTDGGRSFAAPAEIAADIRLVAPRVFRSASGGWFLTMERFDEPSNRVIYSHSADGRSWGELKAIPANVQETGTQSDVAHAVVGGRDLFVFVGENLVPPMPPLDADGRPAEPVISDKPQLYALYTTDSGNTWAAVDPATRRTAQAVPGASLAVPASQLPEDTLIRHFFLRVTGAGAPALGVQTPGDFVFRRPALAPADGRALLGVELGRRIDSEQTRQIAVAFLGPEGNLVSPIELLTARSLSRADARVGYVQPAVTVATGVPFVAAYTEAARGGDVAVYARVEGSWQRVVSSTTGVAGAPTVGVIDGLPHFFWHRRERDEVMLPTRLVYLQPDVSADPPLVRAVNFPAGGRSASSVARFAWSPAPDASGIVGYSHIWTRDPEEPVPTPDVPSAATEASYEADDDGEWYFRIRAVDRLGNWSEPTTVMFFRDTTPPDRVTFVPPALDEEGFLASNTFTLRWIPPEDDPISGYFADLVYVAEASADPGPEDLEVIDPGRTTLQTEPSISRTNYDNGLYALTVRAVDSVGNVGEPAVLYVRMNKYVPLTIISTITAVPDLLGRYSIDIIGRGFTENGRIERVILDRDRRPPYDYVFGPDSPGYRIYSDRSMAGPLLDDIQTGEYYIGLVHSERGLQFSTRRLSIERNGTVKFGDYTVLPGTRFAAPDARLRVFGAANAFVWVVLALMVLVVVFSGSRLAAIGAEGRMLRLEARALISGGPGLLAQRQERISQMRTRGIGLRVKFTFFVVVLVVAIVTGLAVALGTVTLTSQREVLLGGLKDRVDVLLESMVSGSRTLLLGDPRENLDRLEELPRRERAMEEALYATITGAADPTAGFEPGGNYVWATNDPVIDPTGRDPEEIADLRQAQGVQRAPVHPGVGIFLGRTRIEDPASANVETLRELIDTLARNRLALLVRERELSFLTIDQLRREIDAEERAGRATGDLLVRQQQERLRYRGLSAQIESGLAQVVTDALSLVRLGETRPEGRYIVPESLSALEADLAAAREELQLAEQILSHPPFDPGSVEIESDYLFYQPVVEPDISIFPLERAAVEALQEADLTGLTFFRGAVRLGVATDLIVERIDSARLDIIRITVLIALGALAAGVLGALLLATIVVIPINRLVKGVEKIRYTVDKTELKGERIVIRSRDELNLLADEINTMSQALAVAAEADAQLLASSDLLKKFIPLEEIEVGPNKTRKLTTAHEDGPHVEVHGFFEGALELSGDYFAYDHLDSDTMSLIKCDVSGKGIEAAIIVVEVATLYLNQMVAWRSSKRGRDIGALIATINDMVAERGFEGKFATLVAALFEPGTGRLEVSNAGDTVLKIYRAANRTVEKITLTAAPAAGVFRSADMPGGSPFRVERGTVVGVGDILLLPTDGVDDSTRLLRGEDGQPVTHSKAEWDAFRAGYEPEWDPPAENEFDTRFRLDNDGTVKEVFSDARLYTIVEQAMRGGRYELRPYGPPSTVPQLVFDYTGLEPTAANAVTAVMAAERIYRLTPRPGATDPVRVDVRIDAFLRERFSAYQRFFGRPVPEAERPDAKSIRKEYVYYRGLHDERQFDDLTFLAIRRT